MPTTPKKSSTAEDPLLLIASWLEEREPTWYINPRQVLSTGPMRKVDELAIGVLSAWLGYIYRCDKDAMRIEMLGLCVKHRGAVVHIDLRSPQSFETIHEMLKAAELEFTRGS